MRTSAVLPKSTERAAGAAPVRLPPGTSRSPSATARKAHTVSSIAIHAAATLPAGAVDDPAEREADAAADRMLCMADPATRPYSPIAPHGTCAACEEERRAAHASVDSRADAKAEVTRDGAAPKDVLEGLRLPGTALEPASRAFFEPRFGHDFAGIRIHTGVAAERSAGEIAGKAYTVGNDIVFGANRSSYGSVVSL